MVVRQGQSGDAAFRPAAGVGRGVGIDVERRHIVEPVGRRHRRQIDPEPVIQVGAVVGQKPVRPAGPAAAAASPRPGPVPASWPAVRFAGSLSSAGTKPRLTKTMRPSGSRERGQHLIAVSPAPPRWRRERSPCRSGRRPRAATWWNSMPRAAAAIAGRRQPAVPPPPRARCGDQPSFQNSRWICQEPSPRHSRTIGTANTVGQNCGRNPVITSCRPLRSRRRCRRADDGDIAARSARP